MIATIDGIKVDTAVVRTQSGRMRVFSQQMYDVLAAAKKKMNDMQNNAVWISPAGQLIIDKMNALEPRISEQRETVGRFCSFLDGTAQQYEGREDVRHSDAAAV